ncbi:hypothetical protein [Nitrosopumilus sp. b2]|uniref:hypothetical protein n=1 Tax=Nitrosopumilus sp. b2 TaxID=2109908 RepID=UPI0015F50FAB|nr:hypothetical protein [Nitrosopumilus sp. b2]KAF6245215.1 hypothetical protein C6989_04615 [Nitrosopumilus sp. b2]
MTRKRYRFWQKLQGSHSGICQSFSNRQEIKDQSRIHQSEFKMDNSFGLADAINPHLIKISTKSLKPNLKNSKRY